MQAQIGSGDPARGRERRRCPRSSLAADVLVLEREAEQQSGFWAKARDISRGGVFIETAKTVPSDALVRLKIVPDRGLTMRATARVIHQYRGTGFGCAFVSLSRLSGRRLDALLGRTGGLDPISGEIEVEVDPQ